MNELVNSMSTALHAQLTIIHEHLNRSDSGNAPSKQHDRPYAFLSLCITNVWIAPTASYELVHEHQLDFHEADRSSWACIRNLFVLNYKFSEHAYSIYSHQVGSARTCSQRQGQMPTYIEARLCSPNK